MAGDAGPVSAIRRRHIRSSACNQVDFKQSKLRIQKILLYVHVSLSVCLRDVWVCMGGVWWGLGISGDVCGNVWGMSGEYLGGGGMSV